MSDTEKWLLRELMDRLKYAALYLDHPDVQAINFAIPAATVARACQETLRVAEKLMREKSEAIA